MSFLDQLVDIVPIAEARPLTAEERNVVLIPGGPPPSVKQGPLQHADAGPPGGDGPPQRLVAVLGPGATFAGIADTLAPFYATAAGGGATAAPALDELARAIVVYTKDYWAHYAVGLILPLPIEIDPATGGWTVDAGRIRALAASFDAAWRPRLRTPPAALDTPDALDLESAGATLAGELSVTDLAAQLWAQSLRNPFDAVLLFLAALRALDGSGAVTAALAALSSATPAQLSVLAATRAGNAVLRRLASLLGAPPAGTDPAQVADAQALLDNALHQGPAAARTLVPHRDVPQTPAQQAVRRGTARAPDGAAADPPGGLHQVVLGRDVAVGRPVSARVNGTAYTGPAFAGRLDLPSYLTADADHLNTTTDPALLTLLANSSGAGEAGHVQRLDSVAARDPSLVTAGLDQWAATADSGLPALLAAYKAAAPDEFDLFFALHGLDVQPGPAGGPAHQLLLIGPDGTGTVPDADALRTFFGGTADAHGAVTFSPDWAARFRLPALVSAAHRRVQVAQAAPLIDATAFKKAAAGVKPFPAAYALTLDTATSAPFNAKLAAKMATVVATATTTNAQAANTIAAAVADVTDNPATPPYAAFFGDETFAVASLAKIAPMYAAFELKSRVQRIVNAVKPAAPVTPQWWQRLLTAIRGVWGPQIRRPFPDFPQLDVDQIPDLNAMFTIAADGTLSFRAGTPPPGETNAGVIARVQDGHLDPTMRFSDWMTSMILWSNNFAASKVIHTIGFPYINWLLRKAGFFKPFAPTAGHPSGPGIGLWLSGDYNNGDWQQGSDLMLLTARGKAHYKPTTNSVGNCRQVARLLALAAMGKLFDGDIPTCQAMLGMMTKNFASDPTPPAIPGGSGDSTFIGDAITGLKHGDTVSSKIGLGDPPMPPNPPVPANQKGMHDCAVVTRLLGLGNTVRYVAVVLGSYNAGANVTAFDDAARALDACIQELHP